MPNESTPAKQQLEMKIAKMIDDYTFVMNKGSENGISIGQRILVYVIGDEIFDPDTKQSLGRLEVVKGTGKVTHVQSKIATVASDMKSPSGRSVRKTGGGGSLFSMLGGFTEMEEQLPPEPIAFSSPKVGDLVKRI